MRALLQSEEELYMSEIAVKQETTLERQAKMRERARQLREQREQQRLALVDEKLEQRWRNQCEEMRALLTRKHRDEVFTDRAYQLKLNAEKREREKQGIAKLACVNTYTIKCQVLHVSFLYYTHMQRRKCMQKCGRRTLMQNANGKKLKRHKKLKGIDKCSRYVYECHVPCIQNFNYNVHRY